MPITRPSACFSTLCSREFWSEDSTSSLTHRNVVPAVSADARAGADIVGAVFSCTLQHGTLDDTDPKAKTKETLDFGKLK